MKTKRVTRLRRNSMPEQVWNSFALTRLSLLLLVLHCISFVSFSQTSGFTNPVHSDDPRHFAEDLWASVDFALFREGIVKEAQIRKSDTALFFEYLRYKFPEYKIDFFQKVEQGVITNETINNYLQEKKLQYVQQYPLFLQEKNLFIKELSDKRNENTILAVNGPCSNIDFENGTRNGWQGFTGDACTNVVPCNQSNGFSSTRHVITNTSMTDPFIPGLSPVASGGNYSLRLENYQNGGDASGVRQTFQVTSTNNVFTYRYAVVLEDPGDHDDDERPYFKVRMYDQNGNLINCASYTAIAKPPIENFEYKHISSGGINGKGLDLYYRDWTTVSIPMLPYVGQNVTIEFIVSDCSRGGHLAYAYIDAQCSMLDPVTPKYICQNQNITITGTPGFASYSWSGPGIVGADDEQSVVVNAPGDYSVTFVPISDNPCPVTIDFQVQEHCLPPPVSDEFCEETKGSGLVSGIDLNDYAADILAYHSPPGLITSWHKGFPANSSNKLTSLSGLTVHDGDSYYAVISYSNLGITGGDTARLNFKVNSLPDISFTDIADACVGASAFQISGVSPAGGIFSGTHVAPNGIFDPTSSGIFPIKYIYTDANGCTDSLSKSVTVKDAPLADAGSDQSVCSGISSVNLSGSVANAGGGRWSGGNGTFSPDNVSLETTYIPTDSERNSGEVILTFTTTGTAPCAPVSDMVKIKFISGPVVDAGESQSLCETNPNFSLNASVTNASGGTWSGGNGSFSDISALNTTYIPSSLEINAGSVTLTYTASGNAPCTAVSDNVVLTIVPAPVVDAGADQTVCANATTVSLTGAYSNGTGVNWSGGNGNYSPVATEENVVYTPAESERVLNSITFTLTASGNATCAAVSDNVTINFVQPPTVDAGLDQTQCEDNLLFVLNGSGTNAANFSWSGGSGNFSPGSFQTNVGYTPSASEVQSGSIVLTLAAKGMAPCSDVSDEMHIAIAKLPVPDIGPDQKVCEGLPITISTPSVNNESYEWKNKNGNVLGFGNSLSLTIHTDTTLIVYAISSLGCISKDTVEIDAVPYPIVKVENDSICPGESRELQGVISNMTAIQSYPLSMEWRSNGSTLLNNSDKLSVSSGGVYTFLVTAYNCTAGDDGIVKMNPVPVVDMPAEEKFCPELNETILLTAPSGYSYYWMPGGSTGQTLEVLTPDNYSVTVTNEYHCSATDATLVKEVCPPRLFVGNAFSPDGDGINDTYDVHGAHIGHYHMIVFNRWGEVIFESFERTYFWDGFYRGKPMPIGVYPWIITYEGDTEEFKGPYKLEGSVTIVR